MNVTLDIGKVLQLGARVVGVNLSMGEGDAGTSVEVRLLDIDHKIRRELTARTKSIKGIVGVPPAAPSTPALAAAGAPTSSAGVASSSIVGSVGASTQPTGYKLTSKGIPSFPDPGTRTARIKAIIAECFRQGVTDLGQVAYVLATVSRECGNEYKPLAEFGGPSARYAPWYGRGLVQLTWQGNYAKYAALTGYNLLADPDALIRDFGLSAFVLVHGSRTGGFTGRKLSDYINGPNRDFYNARRIINGLDHAAEIAGAAESWLRQLPSWVSGISANYRPTVSTSAPQAVNNPTAVAAGTPASGTGTATEDYPDGDTLAIDYAGNRWELTYTGYTAQSDGTITVVGVGTRKKGVAQPDNPRYGVERISLPDLAKQVAAAAKAELELDLVGEYSETLVRQGGLTRAELLAKLASTAGLVVTDTGNKLILRDKSKVNTHQLTKVVNWEANDRAVSQLSVIAGDRVRAFPTSIVVPLALGILAGDFVVYEPVHSESLTVERVRHDVLAGLTTLDCYLDFEANSKLIVRQTVPVIAAVGGSAVAGTVATAAGGAAGIVDPNGATTSRGVARVRVTSSISEACYFSGMRNKGASSAAGPGGGRVSCAWAVNRWVLEPVFGYLFGDEPGLGFNSNLVEGVEASCKRRGWRRVPVTQAKRGDICICMTLDRTNGHVGMCIDPRQGGDINSLSNSSSRARWDAVYFWEAAVKYRYAGNIRFSYWNADNLRL